MWLYLPIGMPRKGPPKLTRRELNNKQRQTEANSQKSEKAKEKNRTEALENFKKQRNPNMPSSRSERRYLKEALGVRELESWGYTAEESGAIAPSERLTHGKGADKSWLEDSYGYDCEQSFERDHTFRKTSND